MPQNVSRAVLQAHTIGTSSHHYSRTNQHVDVDDTPDVAVSTAIDERLLLLGVVGAVVVAYYTISYVSAE